MGADYYNDTDDGGHIELTVKVVDGAGKILEQEVADVAVPAGGQVYVDSRCSNVTER